MVNEIGHCCLVVLFSTLRIVAHSITTSWVIIEGHYSPGEVGSHQESLDEVRNYVHEILSTLEDIPTKRWPNLSP
ncbi:hypothetical protein BDV40DRAFT_251457 [Aspergillus tamarii]|uniref:Secreted protein n=1 Tax=Aspergillus tamarii TaxID=41984 RepID=A0A5N6VBZ9_ASPTM|nr:hypothetical protein BDV40DRAFT_251457 [Aspergillus tamarii]